ncbi:hypothetical protein AB0D30_19935 [Streptomyces sp. NPDC048409]|uniref:hypothetical protein n=1 Tax=Streptomyces sp. NPDC048409 TaxID=3154723 RepID=UPI003432EF22
MAERLKVDGTELGRLFRDLKKAQESFTALHRVLRVPGVDGLGTADLDKACDRFQEDWRYGAEEIAEQIGRLTDITKKARDDFHEVDVALQRALDEARRKSTDT